MKSNGKVGPAGKRERRICGSTIHGPSGLVSALVTEALTLIDHGSRVVSATLSSEQWRRLAERLRKPSRDIPTTADLVSTVRMTY